VGEHGETVRYLLGDSDAVSEAATVETTDLPGRFAGCGYESVEGSGGCINENREG